MKHKAQESLNELCNHAMDCREECDWEDNWYLEYFDMEEEDLKELRNPIQDLINCQLTVGALDYLISLCKTEYKLSFFANDLKRQMIADYLIEKLQKQKEMWEEQ